MDAPLVPEQGVTQLPPQSTPVSSPSRCPFRQVGLVSATALEGLDLVVADVHADMHTRVPSRTRTPVRTTLVRLTKSSSLIPNQLYASLVHSSAHPGRSPKVVGLDLCSRLFGLVIGLDPAASRRSRALGLRPERIAVAPRRRGAANATWRSETSTRSCTDGTGARRALCDARPRNRTSYGDEAGAAGS